jgi:hypothetical protein
MSLLRDVAFGVLLIAVGGNVLLSQERVLDGHVGLGIVAPLAGNGYTGLAGISVLPRRPLHLRLDMQLEDGSKHHGVALLSQVVLAPKRFGRWYGLLGAGIMLDRGYPAAASGAIGIRLLQTRGMAVALENQVLLSPDEHYVASLVWRRSR